MAILLLIILLIVVGSKVIYKDNFAVITGTISLSNGHGSTSVDYPDGFTRTNCIVISVGMDIVGTDIFSYFGTTISNSIYEARLGPNNIIVGTTSVDNLGSSNIKQFKLVLMKIN